MFNRPQKTNTAQAASYVSPINQSNQISNQSGQVIDKGKRLTINNIIEYFEKNERFLNKPQVLTLDKGDIPTREKINPAHTGVKSLLKDLPTNLKSIFNTIAFFREGPVPYVNVPSDVNISFVSSIISLLFSSYGEMKDPNKIMFVEAFIKKIYKECKEFFNLMDYKKLGWLSSELFKDIKIFKLTRSTLRFIADILHINVFILDVEEDTLYYVGEEKFVRYKKNIFLLKLSEDNYEPLFTQEYNYIPHDSPIIKKLINSKFLVEYMNPSLIEGNDNTDFVVGDDDLTPYMEGEEIGVDLNLDEKVNIDSASILSDDDESDRIDESESEDEPSSDKIDKSNKSNKSNKVDKVKIKIKVDESLKVDELKRIAKENNIDLTYKDVKGKKINKTKAMLIKHINEL